MQVYLKRGHKPMSLDQLLNQMSVSSIQGDQIVFIDGGKKVKVENGVLSTLELSQGQRKRLALLTAYLERRPIYFFDEWAADQDPQFKAVFYFEILPELKALGKTVFVISHDDQYYPLADRLIKMTDGQIEWDRPREAVAAEVVAPLSVSISQS